MIRRDRRLGGPLLRHLARGLGILGTLAIIRFRTPIRDPRDMIFLFACLGVGIACGANVPFVDDGIFFGPTADFADKNLSLIPDFIANAGGVICAAMEYEGASQTSAFATIEEKLRRNTEHVLEAVKHNQVLPRQAAMDMAVDRVKNAMSYRRFSLFSCGPKFI